MMNKTEARKITIKGLVESLKGKHVNILPMDQYGITISMRKATLELEDS